VASHGVESSALELLYEKSVLAVALVSMIFQFATIPLIFVANQRVSIDGSLRKTKRAKHRRASA
jgi:hypothetical protein